MNLKACPCCKRILSPLDKRIGTEHGLIFLNCTCGSTYTVREEDFHQWVNAYQIESAKREAASYENDPVRKARRELAWKIGEPLGFTRGARRIK